MKKAFSLIVVLLTASLLLASCGGGGGGGGSGSSSGGTTTTGSTSIVGVWKATDETNTDMGMPKGVYSGWWFTEDNKFYDLYSTDGKTWKYSNKDKKFATSAGHMYRHGTYSFSDSKLTMDFNGESVTADCSFSGDSVTITAKADNLTYTRIETTPVCID